jgi:hypothetical protein
METEHESLKHLFRREFSKMVAVIRKFYGLEHDEIAEDIMRETFCWQQTDYNKAKLIFQRV